MTTKTLKELIQIEFERCETISQFKSEVFRLIDIFEGGSDLKLPSDFRTLPYQGEPDQVPYGSICSCNPANGGSGFCGCVMGNKMVPNPKKYPGSLTTSSTDKINITATNPYSTNITPTN